MLQAKPTASTMRRAVTAREATSLVGLASDPVRSRAMEGREPRDPGYDDWFDEPEPPTETQSAVGRGMYEDAEEVWVLPEEDVRARGRREFAVGGRTLTTTQAAIIGVSVLAVFFAILAAFGVFNGNKAAAPPLTLPKTHTTTTTQTTTQTFTQPTTQAPTSQLQP